MAADERTLPDLEPDAVPEEAAGAFAEPGVVVDRVRGLVQRGARRAGARRASHRGIRGDRGVHPRLRPRADFTDGGDADDVGHVAARRAAAVDEDHVAVREGAVAARCVGE